MKTIDCDVLVIGAGPAGGAAAQAAAAQGVRVHVLERRRQVGVPVQCAEYIPALLRGRVEMDPAVIAQPVKGMITHLPDGSTRTTAAPGYIIHRDRFDQALAARAVSAGARLHLETRALDYSGGSVLAKTSNGEPLTFNPRVIVGADGPRGRTAQWADRPRPNLLPAAQYRMRLVKPLDHTEVFFDPEIKAGYVWLFPKGREANVGVGCRRMTGAPGLRRLLDRWVERLTAGNKVTGDPLGSTCGWIPVGPPLPAGRENILLAGDAAGQTHPITGAGIFAAVTCGWMAGKWAARSIVENDPGLLREYECEWRELLGDTLQRAYSRRARLESQWHRFDEIIRSGWIAFREYYDESER